MGTGRSVSTPSPHSRPNVSSFTVLAMQLNAIRANLVAGLEQCDAMKEVLARMAEQPAEPKVKKQLDEGETLFATFGGAKAPPPQSSAGENNGTEE